MKKIRLTILFLFTLKVLGASGQPYAVNSADIGKKHTSAYPIYIDNNKLGIDNLLQLDFEKVFTSSIKNLSKHKPVSFWVYINVLNNTQSNVLKIYSPNTESISVFEIKKGGATNKIKSAVYRNDFHIVDIDTGVGKVLINIQTSSYSSFVLRCYTEKDFFLKERTLNLYYGFVTGAFLLLFLYHIVLYLKVRDKLYLFYIFLIITSSLLAIPHSGFININSLYYDIVFGLFQISCLLIGVHYLSLYKKHKLLIYLAIVFIILINTLDIFSSSVIIKYLTHVSSLTIYLAILLASIDQIKSKNNAGLSRLFLLPWIVLFIAHSFYILGLNLVFQYRQIIELGLFANIGLMALAIGNKLNIYKHQKQIAESKELEAIAGKDDLIHKQNIILEQLIQERNKKILEKNLTLTEKKQEIEEKSKIIAETNQELRLINQELLNKNNEILSQNQELKKHQELLEIIVKKRTKKLLAAKERAIVADKLKTSFLNNLTQEINTPMNAIIGFANLLNDKNLDKEKRNEYLFKINENIDNLLETIDNVVVLARIQARIIKPKNKQFSINDLLKKSKEMVNGRLKPGEKNGLQFFVKNENQENKETLYSDYSKIWQILQNLLDNSFKYTTKGQISLNCELAKKEEQNQLILQVKDSGIGIEEEKLQHINKHFSDDEDDKTTLYKKAGLGLAIVKGLVDILNGSINVESTSGRGTSFHVEIPVTVKS